MEQRQYLSLTLGGGQGGRKLGQCEQTIWEVSDTVFIAQCVSLRMKKCGPLLGPLSHCAMLEVPTLGISEVLICEQENNVTQSKPYRLKDPMKAS